MKYTLTSIGDITNTDEPWVNMEEGDSIYKCSNSLQVKYMETLDNEDTTQYDNEKFMYENGNQNLRAEYT